MDDAAQQRLDRVPVTRLHLALLAVCALGFAFDLMEVAMGNLLAAVFSSAPHQVPAFQLSVLLASVYVGAAVGAPLLGWWADRHGRRRALAAAMFWLAATSWAGSASTSVEMLSLCRLLSGLAIGAFPPLVITYLTEVLPPRHRGPLILLTVAFATLGPPAGIFFVRWLTANELAAEPWRWGLGAGAVGTVVIGVLFWLAPESPRWLRSKGRHAEAHASLSAFERSPSLGRKGYGEGPRVGVPAAAVVERGRPRPWATVASLFLLSPWPTVAFPLLSGAVFAQKGFSVNDTLLYVGASLLGPCLGTLLAAPIIDRADRRSVLVGCAAVMLVAGTVFSLSGSAGWLLASSVLFGVVVSVYVSALNLYGGELFPTATRAASLSTAWALNRVGAALAPLLLLPLLRSSGPTAMYGVIAAALVLSMAMLLVAAPRGRQRQPVA